MFPLLVNGGGLLILSPAIFVSSILAFDALHHVQEIPSADKQVAGERRSVCAKGHADVYLFLDLSRYLFTE